MLCGLYPRNTSSYAISNPPYFARISIYIYDGYFKNALRRSVLCIEDDVLMSLRLYACTPLLPISSLV